MAWEREMSTLPKLRCSTAAALSKLVTHIVDLGTQCHLWFLTVHLPVKKNLIVLFTTLQIFLLNEL